MYPYISRDDCYYTGTDSVVLGNPLNEKELSPTELGKFKEEAQIKVGYFLAPKQYYYKDKKEDKETLKHKGATKNYVKKETFEDIYKEPFQKIQVEVQNVFESDKKQFLVKKSVRSINVGLTFYTKRIPVFDDKGVWADSTHLEINEDPTTLPSLRSEPADVEESADELWLGEIPLKPRASSASCSGRSENVGLSKANIGENPMPQKPKAPSQGSSTEGESGPKINAKGLVDGQQEKLKNPSTKVPVTKTETAQCLKVKEVGDLMSGEQSTESSVKGCLNLKGSKIPCSLSSYLHERLNDLGTVLERGSVKIDMSVKMRNTDTSTKRPYKASGFPGIGFSCSYEE
nr:hypothetical protein [Tanacetum cinerariifolium]